MYTYGTIHIIYLTPQGGIEPPTFWLTAKRSTG